MVSSAKMLVKTGTPSAGIHFQAPVMGLQFVRSRGEGQQSSALACSGNRTASGNEIRWQESWRVARRKRDRELIVFEERRRLPAIRRRNVVSVVVGDGDYVEATCGFAGLMSCEARSR